MKMAKTVNEYDEIKGLLSKIRKIQMIGEANKQARLLNEQIPGMTSGDDKVGDILPQKTTSPYEAPSNNEGNEDFTVINKVNVKIHSEDPEDLKLQDEEKNKISQLIDDFRTTVTEVVDFDKLDIYKDSAKLSGKINDLNLGFIFSTGDDTGVYLSNASLLKVDDNSLDMINKLKAFETKFSNALNDLLANREV